MYKYEHNDSKILGMSVAMLQRREGLKLLWTSPNKEPIRYLEVRNGLLVVKTDNSKVVYLVKPELKEIATSGNPR